MMQAIWLVGLLGVGPVLDPIDGSTVGTLERDVLPSARHLGGMADLWFVELVSMHQGDAGLSTFDALRLSSHGRSWAQLRHRWNGLDITDPARSGQPLVELPYGAAHTLRYDSLWTGAPGFSLEATPRWLRSQARLDVAGGAPVGGPLLLPAGFMDREPALDADPARRRELRRAAEVALDAVWVPDATRSGERGVDHGAHLFVEHLEHEHGYPTLQDAAGARLVEPARRTTVLGDAALELGALPVTLFAAWQQRERANDGAELRWPTPATREASATSALVGARTAISLDDDTALALVLGWGYRADEARVHSGESLVRDLIDEWLWLGRSQPSESLERQRLAGSAELTLDALPRPVRVAASFEQSYVERTAGFPGDRVGTTFQQGPALGLPAAVEVTEYERAAGEEHWLHGSRLEAESRARWGALDVRGVAALDHGAIGTPGETRWSSWTPALGLAGETPLGGGTFFALLRREPDAMTSEVAGFLDPARANGLRRVWSDDGDAVPEVGELGAVLARTGGRYHELDAGLRRPTSNQLAFGWETPSFGAFRAVLTGIVRLHMDALTVRMAGPAAASFRAVPFADPGGDGRGEVHPPGESSGQLYDVYERVPGTEGQERYALTNQERDNRFVGTELQLLSLARERWFLNLGAAGYWNIGSGAFGSFPDRNDPGVIDESSADPNGRVHARGRFDQDRSFAVNLMTGVEPIEGLTGAMVLRYRDGQPFTRVIVVDLPQGPTPIMAVWRGAPRHTFHMTVDARVAYAMELGPTRARLAVDGFNLLGSATEVLEDPQHGDSFRDAVELVSPRSILLSLTLDWDDGLGVE